MSKLQDLRDLDSYSDEQILKTLSQKFLNNDFHAKLGSKILVSVNPFTPRQKQSDEYSQEPNSELPLNSLNLANSVYMHMQRTQQDQSIFLLGQGSSGKSSRMFEIIEHISKISKKSKNTEKTSKVAAAASGPLEIVLNAFGNCSTPLNNSASRFGNYTELQFNQKGKLIGLKVLDYLLEKQRVTSRPTSESNFNVFYYLLAGLSDSQKQPMALREYSSYPYMFSSERRPDSTDKEAFEKLKGALKTLGIGKRQQSLVFQVLAAILHMGNIVFENNVNKENEPCHVKNYSQLCLVADLLGVNPQNLEVNLTFKTKMIKNEVCTVFLDAAEAKKNLSDLASTLYSLVFRWIVEQINSRLCKPEFALFIGLVDFPGFSDSRLNGLHQLLFNYSAEQLNMYVLNKTIKGQTEELKACGINAELVDFDPRPAVLDVFQNESKGLLNTIHKACVSSKLTNADEIDAKILESLGQTASEFPQIVSLKQAKFTLKHSLGPIEYLVNGLCDTNMDGISSDFVSLCRGDDENPGSDNVLVKDLFSENLLLQIQSRSDANDLKRSNSRAAGLQRNYTVTRKKSKKQILITTSLVFDFQLALQELMEALLETNMWSILNFCPNNTKTVGKLDSKLLKSQIEVFNLSKILETKSKHDYSISLSLEQFNSVFRKVLDSEKRTAKQLIDQYDTCFTSGDRVFLSEKLFTSLSIKVNELQEPLESKINSKPSKRTDDSASFVSSDESVYDSDAASIFNEPVHSRVGAVGDVEMGNSTDQLLKEKETYKEPKEPMSRGRFWWLFCTWSLTWCIPGPLLNWCGGMKRSDVRMAWREKLALCILIFFICALFLFFIIGLGRFICPTVPILSKFELAGRTDLNDIWVSAYGRIYQINDVVSNHINSYGYQRYEFADLLGTDVSNLFYKVPMFDYYCPGIDRPDPTWDNIANRRQPIYKHQAIVNASPRVYLEYLNRYARARVGWDVKEVKKEGSQEKKIFILYGNVYDVSGYFSSTVKFLGAEMSDFFMTSIGQDATSQFEYMASMSSNIAGKKKEIIQCMNNLFYIGTVDTRSSIQCQLSNYLLLAASILILLVIGVKFLAALQFGTWKEPEDHDKFVICQVPCYTEGSEGLCRTIDSLATSTYDDKRKLLFIICDGMIIGSGNDRPTPRIVLDILGVDSKVDPPSLQFQSLGEGDKQENYAKVYSGLYNVQGHTVPYIVVVKVGKPSEKNRPGNRGKRDSQMILMRFLSRVHFNSEMNPLELEMYHQMKNVIGVNPSYYEYILMVDADTEIMPDAVNRMVSAMIHDSKIMGICGETLISNEKDSIITMIQVYEYFISHHMAKAFESLFGSVTCLPGCFSMYRVRSPVKNVPLLVAPSMITDYSENVVKTLHMKNLLHLGEDRYLTTLMMKHFPSYKLSFTKDAKCRTNVPDRWAVLKSQRRRWINSTVHNLFELIMLDELCGFCCFSMRFVVFLDLFSTVVQPAAIVYIGYLVYTIVTSMNDINFVFPLTSILLIVAVYGIQFILFLAKMQWAQIIWLLIYMLAMPVYSLYLPIYAFWHFDDFSWGNTRVVVGDNGKKIMVAAEAKHFDPKTIALRSWADYEQEKRQQGPVSEKAESVAGESEYSGYSGFAPPVIPFAPMPGMYGFPGHSYPIPGIFGPLGFSRNVEPTDQQIKDQVYSILANADLMSISKRQVREQISTVFGMDLTHRKDWINRCIDDIIKQNM